MANILTALRIVSGLSLLFCPVPGVLFYIICVFAGITDMLDGAVARKTGKACAFGSCFDTVADFVFFALCLIKLLPALCLPVWVYIWTAVIAAVKTVTVVSGFVIRKSFVCVHSVMNRITGAVLYVLPLTAGLSGFRHTVAAVCALASFAAVQECYLILTGRDIIIDRK